MDKDRPEPLIFEAWLSAMRRILITQKTGLPMKEKGPYAAETLHSLLVEHPDWCNAPDKPDPDCRQTISRAFDEALALLTQRDGADIAQWRWGAEHFSQLTHKLYSHVPLLDRLSDLSAAAFIRSIAARGSIPNPNTRSRAPTRRAFAAFTILAIPISHAS
jgi:penicillin amidase